MSNQAQGPKKNGAIADRKFDAVIVGAGFAGMYMLHRLRGMGLSARVYESASGVGGTWFWNRYPGARCDVESMQYSYQFSDDLQQEWEWTERYAAQPEILRYADHVADRFDLRRDIQFNTSIDSATFDETAGQWIVETSDGDRIRTPYCIMATGCLSSPNMPEFKGLDTFRGPRYHTGYWPHEGVDFTGQRVGVIGTGSSAIQSIPIIARQAAHLFVFQRTPNYAIPAHNGPLDPAYQREIKARYADFRAEARRTHTAVALDFSEGYALEKTPEERQREYTARWRHGGLAFIGAYRDLLFVQEANDTAAQFVRERIRETVQDPEVAALLCPDNIIGCKRLCVDTDYYQTYNRPNVTLIDVSESPIEEITPDGLIVKGEEYAFDALVLATGFDAMTGALLKIDIRGRGGKRLGDKWAAGPRTYLGLTTEGFPNLFTITGPGSPSVLANMVTAVEQHVDWITDCIAYMRNGGLARIEPTLAAEDGWVEHVNDLADNSLRSKCGSWYVGSNVPGKPHVFMPYIGGFPTYEKKCKEVVANGYEGFVLT